VTDQGHPATTACPGCGLPGPASHTRPHPYIDASSACWDVYGALLARGPSQDAVDAYAVQHPGGEDRRARQSTAVHLISLCGALERGLDEPARVRLLRRATAGAEYPWLSRAEPLGGVRVDDVLARRASAREWAADLWAAWADHHAQVRAWLDDLVDHGD